MLSLCPAIVLQADTLRYLGSLGASSPPVPYYFRQGTILRLPTLPYVPILRSDYSPNILINQHGCRNIKPAGQLRPAAAPTRNAAPRIVNGQRSERAWRPICKLRLEAGKYQQ